MLFAAASRRGGARPKEGAEAPDHSTRNIIQGRETPSELKLHTHFCVKTVSQVSHSIHNAITAKSIVPIAIQSSPAGQLAHFMANWQILTKDRWVLNTITGYETEFISQPYQYKRPHPNQLNKIQQELVSQEISEMISKGAVTDIQTPPEGGFFSTLFLVPKKDGG